MALDPVLLTPPPEQRDEVAEMLQKYADPERAGEELTIYAAVDGLTLPTGRVARAGDELTVIVGSRLWGLTMNPADGRSWLDMTDAEQVKRWGKVMFRRGPKPDSFQRRPDELERLERRKRRPPSGPLEASLRREWEIEDEARAQGRKQVTRSRTLSQQI